MEIHLLVFIGQSHMHDSYMRDFPLPFACQRVKTIFNSFSIDVYFFKILQGVSIRLLPHELTIIGLV
jgi:hypothetical protein